MLNINIAPYQYQNSTQIIFGVGALDEVAKVAQWGNILLVTTSGMIKRGVTNQLANLLPKHNLTVHDIVGPEPQITDLEQAVGHFKLKSFDCVIGLGGGSAIDTAKIISCLLSDADFDLRAHLTKNEPLPELHPIPVIAIPTTAGTGAEVTPFATVWDRSSGNKYSFSTNLLNPDIAILDPALCLTVPRGITLTTGLDALCQGLESLWSRQRNPMAAAFANQSVPIALSTLPKLLNDLKNQDLRSLMLQSSLLAGLAISSTRTTLSHSMSYPLTLRFGVPHGLACAFTIVQVLRFNADADPDGLRWLVEPIGFDSVDALAVTIEGILSASYTYSTLSGLIPSKEAVLALATESLTPARADNNFTNASLADVESILGESWGRMVTFSS
ncbi:phosphonoacetaldehyde reductase [SAR202 cluster bacterium AD-493-K16_JPT_193m]|nr:phosphonoacetaldehyde reductase [SAR202 cluster bacterium AD-493-K16_JPT_193m]